MAPIVIVGAGIGGLALALALTRAGFDALVLERRPELTVEGAGLQIGPNGTRLLQHLGVFDAIKPHASVPDAIHVHDGATGRALTQLPLGAWMTARHGAPYWVVHRIDLARGLLGAAKAAGVDVRFGVEVEGVSATTDSASVAMSHGSEIAARGVIGADGVWSLVRQQIFDGRAPTPTGRVAARVVLMGDAMANIRRDVVSVWMAENTHLVAYPVNAGAAVNVVLIARGDIAEPQWSSVVEPDAMRARFAVFPDALRGLGDVAGWRQWPLVAAPQLSSYAAGRIALIGDAAHAMMPFLAQGAVMALEDAVVLAHCVTRAKGDAAEAFSAFSAARVPRTQRVVAAAEQNGRIYHLSGAMAAARNATLRVTPGTMLMRRYDWLYGGLV